MTPAIAYLRVSTDAERQSLGLDAQRAAIKAWANREGVEVVAWHTEEVSGGAPLDKRPVLIQALADVDAHGARYLVVAKLDRFSRDPLTAGLAEAELRRHGASIAVADGAGAGDDPASELMRTVLVAVGRFERQLIRARIKAALAVKQQRGEMTGKPRFGYRLSADGVHVEPDEGERAVAERVRTLRAAGLSHRAIAGVLRSDGVVGRSGKPLALVQVQRILRAEVCG